ncbi:glycoside hydrolase family 31 protein [Rhabdobacter roseus]|uniref:Alpha-D-xyloside xylohydrolase n=1 Tax=Rhabdobacter roseus TaxID=1655419 RepID=A0A840U4B1_9BACT|nr:TIM-barrel domain-containing protein [Rhabdobacter roseus]MBB5286930.1 alpha-D-xyloside xylohydrolase [Rhabdobacter roseus]
MKPPSLLGLLRFLLVISFFPPSTRAQVPTQPWEEVVNGVWRYVPVKKEKINLLDAAGSTPNLPRLREFTQVPFPLDQTQIRITKQNGKLYLRFPLGPEEQLYGLGLHFKQVNRRGRIYNLHVDHYGGQDNGRTHAPVPFYVSSRGYGVLINSARYLTVYAGTANRVDSHNPPKVYNRNTDKQWEAQPTSDAVEILVPAEEAEVLVFAGKSPLEVVQKYNLYNGGGYLPPKWGLGFTYRTHTQFSADDVLREVQAFEEQGFPLDFMGLEPGWMSRSYPCSYEWDPQRFPQPAEFVQTLLAKNVRTNLWINPYIAPQTTLYEPMRALAGSHTVWNGLVPDYTLPQAQKVFTDFYQKNHLDMGVSGLKIDENDGYDQWLWPDVATFPSGTEAELLRQTYGLLLQDMIARQYRQANRRTFGLVRASNAGASHLPFVLYNDYYKHEDFITALINSGFVGVLWTPEVRNSASGEEWLRRMQSVCFSPLAMINAWSSGTKPWSYPEVYESVKKVALLRMRLLPYIYSTFAQYHFEGTPPIRPMPLVEGFVDQPTETEGTLDDTNNPYKLATRQDIKDQYLFGESILVAPVFTGQTSRRVILPKGKWYDFYTGKLVGENEVITVEAKLDEIPLFVKDGGLIPMIPPRLHAPKMGEKLPLEVRHYGTAEGRFLLYDDDGETFDFEKGDYSWTELSTRKTPRGPLRGTSRRISGKIYGYSTLDWKFMTP